MELKHRIRAAMEGAGLSPTELASKANVSGGAVTHWLNGATKALKSETAEAIAKATGYNAKWIALGEGSEKPIPESYAPLASENPVAVTVHPLNTVKARRWNPSDPERLVRQFEALLLKLPEANRLAAANAAYQAMIPYLLDQSTPEQGPPGQ